MPNKIIRHFDKYLETCSPYSQSVDDPEPDKSKSISQLSNKELRLLISRLALEKDAEQLIMDLRRNAGEKYSFENPPKIDTTTPINQLYHHGILGQKWGVRRFQNPDGTRTAAGKRRERERAENIQKSEDHVTSRADRKRATEGLSNAELRRLNERLQLEKTYRDLTADEIRKGESFGKSILKEIAKQSLTDAGKELATGLLKQYIVKPILNTTSNKKK